MGYRVKTGVKGLDEMLNGGLMRGDAALIVGSVGTGKTTLGLQYIYEGATKYGENGVIITLEELPQQIFRDAKNFGWDLKKLEEGKRVAVLCASPVDLLEKSETRKTVLGDLVKEIDAQRVFVDTLSRFQIITPDPIKLRQEVGGFINYLKICNLTALLTYELPDVIGGTLRISEYGLEFIVDCVILLRFVEVESSIKKALLVLKMRGSDHDKDLRELEITPKGIEIKTKFKGREGVISGTPTLETVFDKAFKL